MDITANIPSPTWARTSKHQRFPYRNHIQLFVVSPDTALILYFVYHVILRRTHSRKYWHHDKWK